MCIAIEQWLTVSNAQENQYYNAKGLKEESDSRAICKFNEIVESNYEKGEVEWAFKSCKQLAKIHYQQQRYTEVLDYIVKLMRLLPQLNGNYAEESMSKLLAKYSACLDAQFVSDMYDVITSHLKDSMVSGASGDRLWLRININRLNNLLSSDPESCQELIKQINSKLDRVSELTRNSYALDVIAAEIECAMGSKSGLLELSELYQRSEEATPAIIHPRTMGIIKECGATVQFLRRNFDRARVEFYECFKSYDEAGSPSKNKILKYLTLCCLLVESEVNPFESQETLAYAQLSEYQNLLHLVKAYERHDLQEFLHVLESMKLSNDPLAKDHIFLEAEQQILHNLKVKMLLNFIEAYKTIKFDYIIQKLKLKNDEELEDLLLWMASNGSGAAMKTNFVARFVESTNHPQASLVNVSGRTFKTHLDVFRGLSYNGPWNRTQESRSSLTGSASYEASHSVLQNENKPCFPQSIETVKDGDEWVKYMMSAIPKTQVRATLQKDDVATEQQEVAGVQEAAHDAETEEAAANTQKGLLGSAVVYNPTGEPTPASCSTKDKLGLLAQWTRELSVSLDAN